MLLFGVRAIVASGRLCWGANVCFPGSSTNASSALGGMELTSERRTLGTRRLGFTEAPKMRPCCLGRYVLSISAAALLAGCGGSQPPIAEPGVPPQDNPMANVPAKGQRLLYVADLDGFVEIVSYPAGKKVGSISYGLYSYLGAECADRSGNVW